MKRRNLHLAIDAATLVAMLCLVWTGIVVRYFLPPGTGGRGGGGRLTLWGASRHEWGDLHFWLAVAVVTLVAVHVVLHWSWICATTRNLVVTRGRPPARMGRRALAIYAIGLVGALALVSAGFLAVGSRAVSSSSGGRHGAGIGCAHHRDGGSYERPRRGHGRRGGGGRHGAWAARP